MKKILIKSLVFVIVFIVSLLVAAKIMNKDHDNLTMEVAPATLPVVTMERNGIEYNRLYGYKEAQDVKFQRDTITVLDENRSSDIRVDTYDREIAGISIQVRSSDGSRLIEDSPVTEHRQSHGRVLARIALKDLIEPDTEYSLTLCLELADGESVYYYTRVIWSDRMAVDEKLAFALDFHEKTYDQEAAQELTRYLETNSRLEDNRSFHKVNIHSTLKQITWDGLPVKEVGEPVMQLTAIAGQTASVLVDYMVSTQKEEIIVYYQVQEHFRVRYTTERMYLLDYERTMTQIPDVKHMYANDKILLGITGEEVPLVESEDGNIVAFEVAGKLCCYNVTTNQLAVIFSFYDEQNMDVRTLHQEHAIKILDVDESGSVRFAVYGYMNRGRHEGEVGIQLYAYDSAVNTIEELVFIGYDKTFSVLQAEMEQLLYLNREQQLYLMLENVVYEINLQEKNYSELVTIFRDDSLHVSDNHMIMVWQDAEDVYRSGELHVKNLNNGTESVISVEDTDAIRPLGFMGEDLIYGVARMDDIVEDHSGRVFFPMYKVGISNSAGELLKEYREESIYITQCSVRDNQITLERLVRDENGNYQETIPDHIMNNTEEENGKNTIVTAVIDIYKTYVQIKTKGSIDSKSIKILTPKEVVFEGGRNLELTPTEQISRYYVYGPYGVEAIYNDPGHAVNLAYEMAGTMVDNNGSSAWIRGNRVNRNQIMAIKEETVTPEKSSLAVCLDTVLGYEGVIRNSEYLLGQGQTVLDILGKNLPDAQVLDLSGCVLDAVLYYVNQDIPVLALLDNGEAVLVTGFNELNVVIMDPVKGTLAKMGMKDATAWFAENGNRFVTYMSLL